MKRNLPIRQLDDVKKSQLKALIKKKQKKLGSIKAKYEMLRVELELIQKEYDVRIGKLFLKDNQLDLEIIRLHQIINLMAEGKSYFEAEVALEDTFYNEEMHFKKRSEEIADEERFFEERYELDGEKEKELKSLWRKLILRFHPDLTTNKAEKQKREIYTKQINSAYADNDLETLMKIDDSVELKEKKEITLEDLEQVLANVENMIIKTEMLLLTALTSEWYSWRKRMQKAKRKNEDVFKQLEKKLLDDIVRKIEVVQGLRMQVTQNGAIL